MTIPETPVEQTTAFVRCYSASGHTIANTTIKIVVANGSKQFDTYHTQPIYATSNAEGLCKFLIPKSDKLIFSLFHKNKKKYDFQGTSSSTLYLAPVISKICHESIGKIYEIIITELLSLNLSKAPILDNVNVSDSFNTILELYREFFESVIIDEKFINNIIKRLSDNNVNLSDNSILNFIKAVSDNNINEGSVINDIFSTLTNYYKYNNETTIVTDLLLTISNYYRVIIEPNQLYVEANYVEDGYIVLGGSVTLSDNSILNFIKAVSDNNINEGSVINDIFSTLTNYYKYNNETTIVTDLLLTISNYYKYNIEPNQLYVEANYVEDGYIVLGGSVTITDRFTYTKY